MQISASRALSPRLRASDRVQQAAARARAAQVMRRHSHSRVVALVAIAQLPI